MSRSPAAGYVKLLASVALPFYALDQLTKWIVLSRIGEEEIRPVIPEFFYLVRWYNTGAAFSLFSNGNAFFLGLSLVALLVLGVMAYRNLFQDGVSRFGWALLLAGILGNLTDRIIHGHVVDFLLFFVPVLPLKMFNPWPAFNVADACICVAAGLFVWQSFREQKTAS